MPNVLNCYHICYCWTSWNLLLIIFGYVVLLFYVFVLYLLLQNIKCLEYSHFYNLLLLLFNIWVSAIKLLLASYSMTFHCSLSLNFFLHVFYSPLMVYINSICRWHCSICINMIIQQYKKCFSYANTEYIGTNNTSKFTRKWILWPCKIED